MDGFHHLADDELVEINNFFVEFGKFDGFGVPAFRASSRVHVAADGKDTEGFLLALRALRIGR